MPICTLLPPRLLEAVKRRLFYAPVIAARALTPVRPPLFAAVFFEVVTRCNSRCQFCHASVQNEKRPATEMPFALYRKVVDELAGLSYTGRVAWHVNNDPLLFSGLEDFVAHARERLPKSHLQILTNGILLTPERGRALILAGVDEIQVDFYRERPGQELYANLRRFRDQVLPEFFPRAEGAWRASADGSRRFLFKVVDRALDEVLTSRGGSSPNKAASSRACAGFCIYPWSQFNVTTDGRVSKCCSDFYFADPMGNVAQQGVLDIWHGEKFAAVRQALWRGDRSQLPQCARCDFFGVKNAHIRNPLVRAIKYHCFARN